MKGVSEIWISFSNFIFNIKKVPVQSGWADLPMEPGTGLIPSRTAGSGRFRSGSGRFRRFSGIVHTPTTWFL